MKLFLGLLLIIIVSMSCQDEADLAEVSEIGTSNVSISPTKATSLWNGIDFSEWEFYLADSSINPADVWKVKDSVIHCVGIPNGYMKTKKPYTNYKLSMEWRWADHPSNSGVLLNLSGEDKIWPYCIEAQLMNGNAGDFYLIGGTSFQNVEGNHSKRMKESSEKPIGEWNKYEIFCSDSSITLFVNGILQNEGNFPSVTSGRIGFQSEGTPIEFKNIFIEPLTK